MIELFLYSVSVGPLILKEEQVSSKACSAFVVREKNDLELITANHCVLKNGHRLWFPNLKGSVFNLRNSEWKSVVPIPSSQSWNRWGNSDIVSTNINEVLSVPPLIKGGIPNPGDNLRVYGYPRGQGVEVFNCKYEGVVVLQGKIPIIRPSLRCNPHLQREIFGASGGPVLNDKNEVVGVLSSGTLAPDGGYLLGFEILNDSQSKYKNGSFRYPYIYNNNINWITVNYLNNQLVDFEIKSDSGVMWTYWKSKVN